MRKEKTPHRAQLLITRNSSPNQSKLMRAGFIERSLDQESSLSVLNFIRQRESIFEVANEFAALLRRIDHDDEPPCADFRARQRRAQSGFVQYGTIAIVSFYGR
jgi:hypothetical protein